MTADNDNFRAPPPRPVAPPQARPAPGAPQRPAHPAAAPVSPFAGPGDVDPEAKTAAIDIAALGLMDDDDDFEIMPAPQPRQAEPRRTLLGHPALQNPNAPRGAATSGSGSRAQADDPDRTLSLSDDDLAQLSALAARPGAPSAHAEEDERTQAFSLEDLDVHPAPARRGAPPNVAAQGGAPGLTRRPSGVDHHLPIGAHASEEKTTALSLDDVAAIEEQRASAHAAPLQKVRSASAPARTAAAPSGVSNGDGFVGAMAYALQHDALQAQMKSQQIPRVALSAERKAAGLRNLIIVGGVVAGVIVITGIFL